uniref:Uncharacterized protein n=1 Tax=Vitis vinifera TaxID=29760 RepID=A5ASD1_VITVI|nr:hypothetical protein VITISV_037163 [Vitis vinifera]
MPEPPRPLVVSPLVEDVPMSPHLRRYEMRRPPTTPGTSSSCPKKSGSRPLKKKARVRDPTVIHFTIDGRHGILGARHIVEALRIPYKRASLGVEERSFARGIVQDIRGILLWPHHLIMAAFLYFEEKVHRKKLLRVDAIPLLFPRLLCQILEYLGYPFEPQLERRRICREIFTLDKWTSMTAYGVEPGAPAGLEHPEIPHPQQPEEPQPVKIPADMRAPAPTVPSTEPIPEVAPSAPPATPWTPPVIPSILEPPPSSEPRITISMSEYRGLCHTFQALAASQSILTQQVTALRAHQEQIIATQTQHTAIGKFSTIWVFYQLLSTSFLSSQSQQSHHRPLIS